MKAPPVSVWLTGAWIYHKYLHEGKYFMFSALNQAIQMQAVL